MFETNESNEYKFNMSQIYDKLILIVQLFIVFYYISQSIYNTCRQESTLETRAVHYGLANQLRT